MTRAHNSPLTDPDAQFLTVNFATGEFSAHETRAEATQALTQMMDDFGENSPTVRIMERVSGMWRFV